MSGLVLTRLRDLFLAPAEHAPATQVAERAVPSTLAVLAAGADAPVAGAALGLVAAGALRARCAVVCVWPGAATSPRPGLATVAARRTADRLAARGLVVAARGRLVTVALPAAEAEARAGAERAMAAAGDAPTVLVIAGPRPPALDPMLASVDRIVIVPPPDAPSGLEALAVDAAAHLGRSTAILRLPRSGATANHVLTTTGLVLPPSLRSAAASALEGGHG